LIPNGDSAAKVSLSDGVFEVQGREVGRAVSARYAQMFQRAGFRLEDCIDIRLRPGTMSTTFSGNATEKTHEDGVTITVSTAGYKHTQ